MDANRQRISVFQMAVMATIAVASLRSLPAMAVMGWASILLFLIPALLFFVPVSLVSAELSASVPGGVYEWIKEALGPKWALVAVWVQWAHNIVWYPAQLAFIGATAAAFINMAHLSESGLYTACFIVVMFWGAVWVGSRGGNLFAKIASRAGLIGTLIPAAILVVLGILWIVTGRSMPGNALEGTTLLPKMAGPASIAFIVSNFLAFAGMEVNSVHASHLPNPRRDYVRVVGFAFVGALSVFIVPTLIMSMVLKNDPGHISNGVVLAFSTFFDAFGLSWMGNVVYLAIVFGGIASIVTWISGPSRILFHAAKDGTLPDYFARENANGAQMGILVIMGIIVTGLAGLYLIFPSNVSAVFSVLIGMAIALYLIMYLFLFAAAIILRRTGKSGTGQGFRAPALVTVAIVGMVASTAAFIMTFVPQEGQHGIPPLIYPILVAAFVIILSVPSFYFYSKSRHARTGQTGFQMSAR